ncbi:hypothetical protein G7Y89_g13057 [Cudoniella acicularis]|uniref:Beta-xylosidase C-terminal Concanavalin A-like domain-containing protein n=1 Tax=Cudoniella acicularis TaxID=354080 RepID=A0A8H4RA15_9HELO|nr:hypothetical protein G7Y89_g13057 [Cudoniella acicularis]
MASLHTNPIIPGFAPDPSIVLIDDTFFLVNSSFHVFPGLPIYSSKDLLSWSHVGNAINRTSQLSLAKTETKLVPWDNGDMVIAAGGLFAPTIRHNKGTTYIICTNVCHGKNEDGSDSEENFIISTKDILSNEWSDPVYFDFRGIDPSLFFDDDGRVYVQACATPEFKIMQFEIDIRTGKHLSDQKNIWEGFDKNWSEGPHMYKKDGFYYLIIAEGGTFDHHMLSAARATDIWGPYTSFKNNPIITANGTDEYIQHVGHGDIFQDTQSSWWAVVLGVRKAKGRFVMGRETFLTPVTWKEGCWPIIAPAKTDPIRIDGRQQLPERSNDETLINTPKPSTAFIHIRDPNTKNYKFSKNGRTFSLLTSHYNLSTGSGSPSFVGKRQRALEGVATVLVHLVQGPHAAGVRAGLALYKDEHRHAAIFYDHDDCQIHFAITNKTKSFSRNFTRKVESKDKIELRISYSENTYAFSYRERRMQVWEPLDSIDTAQMSGFDFTGPIVGVFTHKGTSSKAENTTEAPAPKRYEQQHGGVKSNFHYRSLLKDDDTEEVLDLYLEKEDANNRVRRKWEEFCGDEDNFDTVEADFDGGSNEWSCEDGANETEGIKGYIRSMEILGPGSEPARK